MDTLQQPGQTVVILLSLLSLTLVAMIVIRRSPCMRAFVVLMIHCTLAALLLFGAIVPAALAMLGTRSTI